MSKELKKKGKTSDPNLESEAGQEPQNVSSDAQNSDEALKQIVSAMESFEQALQNRVMLEEQRDVISSIKGSIEDSTKKLFATWESTQKLATPDPRPGAPCPECECSCSDCCCFEIVLDKARATQAQGLLEPGDSGSVPGFINPLEVQIYAHIDNMGVLVPGIWNTLKLHASLTGKPGPWHSINQVISKKCIKKGEAKTFIVNLDAAEREPGAEAVPHVKDEYGFAKIAISLDCCSKVIYPPLPASLRFDQGGAGGLQEGEIEISILARRTCC